MQVYFEDAKLQKVCNSHREMVRKLGKEQADRLKVRLADLEGVDNAAELITLPGRWHQLSANRTGQMSGDLKHPQRLIIEPLEPDDVRSDDGGIDWEAVTDVVVIEIADTHQ